MPDAASFTSGMLTGAIQGSYYFGLSNLKQLESSSAVKVYQGPGQMTDAFVVSATSGPLTNPKVRQALSMALDRQAIISNVYDGAALMPRWLANPGTFGYGTSVFDAAYDSSPVLNQDLAQAKKLAKEAGVAGQTITIGTSSELASISAETGAYQQAAEAIGLKVVLKSVSAADYINFFTSAAARKGIDGFITVNYGDYADPAALLSTRGAARRRPELRRLQQPADDLAAGRRAQHRQPGSAGAAGRQGRGARGEAAAVDPERAADQRPHAEQ